MDNSAYTKHCVYAVCISAGKAKVANVSIDCRSVCLTDSLTD